MVGLLIGLIPPVVLWTALLARVRTLRRGRTEHALGCTLLACALAATLQMPAVGAWLVSIVEAPNAIQVAKHVLVIVAAGAAREVVRSLAFPGELAATGATRRYALGASAVIGVVVAYAASSIGSDHTGGLSGDAAAEPSVSKYIYWLIYLVFLAATLFAIARLCVWFGRNAPPGSLRTGLVFVGIGSAAGLVYVGNRLTFLVASLVTDVSAELAAASTRLSSAAIAISLVCLVAGMVLPAARHLPGLRRIRVLLSLRRLRPLWVLLNEATPSIALQAPDRTNEQAWWSLVRLEARLYDRVVEIQDGLLALRAHSSSTSSPRAGGRPDSAEAVAGWTISALAAKTSGSRPSDLDYIELPSDGDLHDVIQFLERIARALPRRYVTPQLTGTNS